jgi:pyruvate,water dikinase
MNATFTNVQGVDALVDRITRCWESLFGARVVAYRAARGYADEPAIAVVVQVMVAAERSGVAFTADPATGRRDVVVVEAALRRGTLSLHRAGSLDRQDSLRRPADRRPNAGPPALLAGAIRAESGRRRWWR